MQLGSVRYNGLTLSMIILNLYNGLTLSMMILIRYIRVIHFG